MIGNNKTRNLRKFAMLTAVSSMGLLMSHGTALGDVSKQKFDIPAQSLSSALLAFSKQTNINIVASGTVTKGKISGGAVGKYSADEALKYLLEKSGVTYEFKDDKTLLIHPQGMMKKGVKNKTGKTAMLQQGPGGVTIKTAPSPVGSTGSISGHVTEINNGSNLAGALVKIVETGQTTKTDDLGSFRFASVAPGNYTLSIAYLGYASLITEVELGRGEEFQNEFSMGKPLGELDEIVVFGSRSARALALNLQRTAENNSDVISADMLGNFTGTTISEALRRVTGVGFQRDPITGDGTNIYIRGLGPAMNAVKLNGLNIAVGSGFGRAPDLSALLADSVSKITIHKSLLPSHDSAGTGGLVEIETKSPLNRPHRYISLSAEGDRKGSDFGEDFLLSGTVAGTFGSEENLGLSASVQYRERDVKNFRYYMGQEYGEYMPLASDGSFAITNGREIHPQTPFPFEPGADGVYANSLSNSLHEINSSNLGITLSAEWQIADHTNLNLDYQHSTGQSSTYSRSSFLSTPLEYNRQSVAALNGEERWALGWDGTARLTQSYSSNGSETANDNYSLRGRSNFGKWELKYTLGYVHGSRSQDPGLSINMSSGDLVFDEAYLSSAAVDPTEGRIISPFGRRSGNGYPVPFLNDDGWDFVNDPTNYNFTGGGVSAQSKGYNDRYTAKFSSKYDVEGKYLKYVEVGFEYEGSKSSSVQITPYLSLARPGSGCLPGQIICAVPNYTLDEVGFSFEEANLSAIGISGQGFNVIGRSDVEDFFENIPDLTSGDDPFLNLAPSAGFDARKIDAYTKENSFSGYLQARIDIGKLEIIGGVRVNRVDVKSFALNSPTLSDENGFPDEAFAAEFERLDELNGTATDILPRFQFNYRENDNLVFRGSYYLSVARPGLESLSDHRQITLVLAPVFGPNNNQPYLSLSEGNPELKPANTHNLDTSIEYYDDDIGLFKLSAFYKRTTNQLETNFFLLGYPGLEDVVLPDHPAFQENLPDNLYIVRSRPENTEDPATLWGIEAHIERRFTFLPGFWNGFGVFANYSFTKSSKVENVTWFYSPVVNPDGSFNPLQVEDGGLGGGGGFGGGLGGGLGGGGLGGGGGMPNMVDDPDGRIQRESVIVNLGSVSYNGAPRHSGTVALTYNKHGVDATLTYSFQGKYTSRFAEHYLMSNEGGVGTLDFRASYYFEVGVGRYRVFFEGRDLLKSPGSPDLEDITGGTNGVPETHIGAHFIGGRALKIGLSANF